jgi:antirestriction protein ArdC
MVYGTASYYRHLRFEPATDTIQAAAIAAHRPAEADYLAALGAALGAPVGAPAGRES